tara:strand:- start:89 stop:475 length:387 start_codon:yes stop_codon:yes gene_type:complete
MRSLNPEKIYASAEYNFAVDGGAINGIVPSISSKIPADALITEAFIEGIVQPTGGGNMKIQVGTVGGTTTDLTGTFDRTKVTATGVFSGLLNNTLMPKKIAAAGDIILHAATAITGQGTMVITIGYTL